VEQRAQQLRRDARREYRRQRDKIRGRVQEYLAQLEQAVPEAPETSPEVRTRGRNGPQTIDAFLTDVLRNVDGYWTRTFRASGLPEPSVSYDFFPPGTIRRSGCGVAAGSDAAFYCPADDTIYVSQQFAADLYRGVVRGLPGESAGYGRAAGDFAVAYVLAHEYAHNLQQELGIFDNRVGPTAQPFELQADCWAGSWANSVYAQGRLDPADLDEILNAALAVGDFDVGNETHHGTPQERRDAVLTGFRSGDPSVCRRYVPET
jgi:predicted metalloprotease